MLYMFRTVLVQLQEQLLQAVHRIWYMPVCADMSVSGVAIATDDGIIQSETCTASNRK